MNSTCWQTESANTAGDKSNQHQLIKSANISNPHCSNSRVEIFRQADSLSNRLSSQHFTHFLSSYDSKQCLLRSVWQDFCSVLLFLTFFSSSFSLAPSRVKMIPVWELRPTADTTILPDPSITWVPEKRYKNQVLQKGTCSQNYQTDSHITWQSMGQRQTVGWSSNKGLNPGHLCLYLQSKIFFNILVWKVINVLNQNIHSLKQKQTKKSPKQQMVCICGYTDTDTDTLPLPVKYCTWSVCTVFLPLFLFTQKTFLLYQVQCRFSHKWANIEIVKQPFLNYINMHHCNLEKFPQRGQV